MIDPDTHHLERIDLLVDAHGADLGRRACADGRGKGHTCRRRCDEPDIEEGAEEAGEGFDADVGQGVVALHCDQSAGGQREEADDDDRATDDGQCTGAHAHARDLAQHHRRVTPDGVGGRPQRLAVEGRLLPEPAGAVDHLPDRIGDAGGLVQR